MTKIELLVYLILFQILIQLINSESVLYCQYCRTNDGGDNQTDSEYQGCNGQAWCNKYQVNECSRFLSPCSEEIGSALFFRIRYSDDIHSFVSSSYNSEQDCINDYSPRSYHTLKDGECEDNYGINVRLYSLSSKTVIPTTTLLLTIVLPIILSL
ncbi:hypothetical protein CYY_007942 [Polysphondylium violaceum]|uniref:Uncharacterized protein n=1 Tax=Polysphondylium violaceum TaxID=133409 RepID=A0A8J4PNM5_9MYCE|nr:hypothetical protein CYY_007942 [Polysphondylium violaceum]